jgi:hypothetical protein
MPEDAPVAGNGEILIEHPEVPGAVVRLPSASFDPTHHTPWPDGQVPWMDGGGQPIAGRSAPAEAKPKKTRTKPTGPAEGGE